MSSSHIFLRYTRLVHLYIGVFIAPALLFFAFTGALQTFSLHETTRGSSYKAADKTSPEKAAQDKPQLPAAPASQSTPNVAPKLLPDAIVPQPHNTLPLKIFFLLVAIGLFTSTLSGLYMSYKYIRNRSLISAILLAGVIVPFLLTIF
jgi:uncharacterized iron-regulated membrane protein